MGRSNLKSTKRIHGLKALILVLMATAPWVPFHGLASTNWSRLAVMPFHNITGDKALEPWRHGFEHQVSKSITFAQPFRFELCDDMEVGSALTNNGWRAESEITAELASKVAAALRCGTAVLGEFSRADGVWNVKIRVIHVGKADVEHKLELENRSTYQLLLQLEQGICASLGVALPEAGVSLMRDYPVTDGAWDKLVRMDAETEMTKQAKIAALREILESEPNCYSARSRLVETLLVSCAGDSVESSLAKKMEEASAESKKLVEQAPGLCPGHVFMAACLGGWKGSSWEPNPQVEQELLAALKAHPGCPHASKVLFRLWAGKSRWEDLRRVAAEAHQALPAEAFTSAFLALAMVQLDDLEAASALISELDATEENDVEVHLALLCAGAKAHFEVMARELLWMQRHSVTNAAEPLHQARRAFAILSVTTKPVACL